MSNQYDLVVIGAGPGGYVAAIRASQLGLKVAIIEKDKPGGVCLNIGCIPSKALIHQAELYRSIPDLESTGVKVDLTGFDYSQVFKKSRQAADRLSKGVQFLLKKNKVDYLTGEAKFTGPHEVVVNGAEGSKTLTGKNVLIATGSSPRVIPGFEFDEEKILSSTGALMLEKLPKSMVILGAGAIGMEFAHILSSFGTEITVVEMLDQILPLEDAETAEVIKKDFEKRGIKLITGTKASSVSKEGFGITLEVEPAAGGDKTSLEAEKLLVAIGRAPNTSGLGLEEIGVQVEKGFIKVGDYYETAVKGVFAIGDVVATPLLAHVASKEGEIAVEYMAGKSPEKHIDLDLVPSAVYCEPQIGSFGLTVEKARGAGKNVDAAIFPFRGIGKAVATGHAEGLVKIVFDPETKEIHGAHVAGPGATELIHELLLAKKSELVLEDIAEMVHAHPTLSEGVMEAARAAEGWAIHI